MMVSSNHVMNMGYLVQPCQELDLYFILLHIL